MDSRKKNALAPGLHHSLAKSLPLSYRWQKQYKSETYSQNSLGESKDFTERNCFGGFESR